MHRGYVKNYRKIKDWEWYTDIPVCHLFQHLIREAKHEDGKWRGIPELRGQLITGLHRLSEETGLSVQQLRTALKKLESTGDITSRATNKYRVITDCNYNTYHPLEEEEQQAEQQATQQASNKQATTPKNYKNDKKVKNKTYRPDFVSQEDWSDLLDHRKKHPKKPTNSDRALKILAGKIQKTMAEGFTSTQIVEKIIARNWQTIEPEWMVNSSNQGGTNGKGQQRQLTPAQERSEERRVGKECRSRWPPTH